MLKCRHWAGTWRQPLIPLCRVSVVRNNGPLTVDLSSRGTFGFPYEDSFQFDGQTVDSATILDLLSPFVSKEREAIIDKVVKGRTFSVLPVVEGVADLGNTAAVFRSADAMGYGAVHMIGTSGQKHKSTRRSSAGADKWLEVVKWNDTQECLKYIKNKGYKIVVAHVGEESIFIEDVDWTEPSAIVLGNEVRGVSATAIEMADCRARIPMTGFVESFNISVAAALAMYEARRHRINVHGFQGDLSEKQQQILKAVLYLKSMGVAKDYVKELLRREGRR